MQEYFEHTSEIRYSSAHFVEAAEDRSPARGMLGAARSAAASIEIFKSVGATCG